MMFFVDVSERTKKATKQCWIDHSNSNSKLIDKEAEPCPVQQGYLPAHIYTHNCC